MTTPDLRDRALETALRRAGSGPGPASADCLDAETLAAWADGTLDATAIAHAESHMADCARCQAVMAAMVTPSVETSVEDEAASGAGGRTWWPFDVRWLVPLAGAAAALVIWMVLPNRPPEQVARLEEPTVMAPAAAYRDAPPSTPPREVPPASAPVAATPPAPPTGARAKEPAARQEPAAAAPSADARADLRAGAEADATRANEAAVERRARDAAVPPQRQGEIVAGLAAPASPAPPPPAAQAVAAEPGREAARLDAAPSALGKTVLSAAADNRLAAAGGIVSSDPSVRWRLSGPGVVERSRDAGASWERLETSLRTTYRAGASPSPDVCWLVGDGGLVVVTTDARTWRRVTSPVTADLVAVEAATDLRAIVRTAAGRGYRTEDGGTTWTRVP